MEKEQGKLMDEVERQLAMAWQRGYEWGLVKGAVLMFIAAVIAKLLLS